MIMPLDNDVSFHIIWVHFCWFCCSWQNEQQIGNRMADSPPTNQPDLCKCLSQLRRESENYNLSSRKKGRLWKIPPPFFDYNATVWLYIFWSFMCCLSGWFQNICSAYKMVKNQVLCLNVKCTLTFVCHAVSCLDFSAFVYKGNTTVGVVSYFILTSITRY